MTEPFVMVYTDSARVEVWRGEVDGDHVVYELRDDDVVLASLTTSCWYPPHVASFGTRVALWAGPRLLVLDRATGTRGTWEDELGDVRAVLPLGAGWLVLTELAVSRRSADLATEHARYDHHEVMLDARLDGDTLVVRDFDGVEVVLDAATLAVRS